MTTENKKQTDISEEKDNDLSMSAVIAETAAAYSKGMKKKNCLDEDLYMHIPSDLQKLFKNGKDVQPPSALDHEDLLNYECSNINMLPARTITEEEYNEIPDYLKNKSEIILYSLKRNIVRNIIIAVLLAAAIIGLDGFVLLAAVLILVAVFSFLTISECLKKTAFLIRKDTQVKVGRVARFTTDTVVRKGETDSEFIYYYIDMFMNELDVIAKKIEVPAKVKNDLELNSKVFVIGSHFVYEKDGKWNLG